MFWDITFYTNDKIFLKINVINDGKAVSMDAHMILVYGNQVSQS